MTQAALIIFVSAAVIVLCRYVLVTVEKMQVRSHINMELNQMFHWFWDGTPEDRLYAWYKVRVVLQQREGKPDKRKIAQVDQKIIQLDKQGMCSNVSVDCSGKLIGEDFGLIVN